MPETRFPLTDKYAPEWLVANASGGANVLQLTEWLASGLELKPGMRVLDLGCGRGLSSIFLHREFGVQVWATDLWFNATENGIRFRDCGVDRHVFPIHADARALPFAADFFDAMLCVDAFVYFGTDDLYLNYLAQFVKPDGQLGIAGAGLTREVTGAVPEHLQDFWMADAWSLHSPEWWRRHWEKTGLVRMEIAESHPDGWSMWRDWLQAVSPHNQSEITTIERDAGQYLGYFRCVGRRNGDRPLADYCWPDPYRSFPTQYTRVPMLKADSQ